MWFEKIWNGLMFMLCRLVYLFIKWLYQVFEAVSKANLFTEEVFDELTGRIYLIMGIAMLFIFAYNLVFMIVDPDNKTTNGKMGKIVKETIVSLIAVVLLPTIFNYMYTFQNHVVSSNILGQLILGGTGTGVQDPSECDEGDYECKCDFSFMGSGGYAQEIQAECESYRNLKSNQRGANLVPVTIFSAFYRPANFTLNECANHLANNTDSITGDDHDICVEYYAGYQMAKYTGKISYLIDNDDLKDGLYENPKLMEFDNIFALLAGALAVWMFLCYAMEIGVRVFKLGVLQLISPIPVMMRVIPGQKEKMYKTWFDELIKTYLDVFIRLIIIFFALFAVSLVPEMIETLWSSIADGEANGFVKLLAMVIVILGILKFAQEAPELLKTFFKGSGSFALRSPSKQIADNKLGGAALGMTGAAAASSVGNLFNAGRHIRDRHGWKRAGAIAKLPFAPLSGAIGGAFRGMVHGYGAKGFKDLGKKIAEAKEATDTAYNAGLGQRIKHRANRIGAGFEDFGQFIAGTGASNIIGTAANTIMIDVDNMESEFSNAEIANIKSGRDEIQKKFNSDQAFDYNGKHYKKISATEWNDGTQNIKSSDLKQAIVDDYKDRLAMAYAANELKTGIIDGFKRANEGMLKDLRDALPKFGNEFSDSLFTKLNGLKDVNGNSMNLDVHSIDELEKRMNTMIDTAKKNGDKELLASIYKINDEIKSAAKGKKIQNDQALKAQAANKDKKDK